MTILDIDMDFFLKDISKEHDDRQDDNFPEKWNKDDIIYFLENNLKLNKKEKIPGFIITNHDEALIKWKYLIDNKKLNIPFDIIHVDSHSDLWGTEEQEYYQNMNCLRGKNSHLRQIVAFGNDNYINEGNYLLFAIWFEWVNKLTYCANPSYKNPDIQDYVFKENINFYGDKNDDNLIIQLSPHEKEVNFRFLKELNSMRNFEKYDYIIFSQSPEYTPKSLDYVIEIMKEYIKIIN